MVYCSKCGTKNPEHAAVCYNCGAPLYEVGNQYLGSEREHYRRMESECFDLPNAGTMVGLVFGIIIILAGLGLFIGLFVQASVLHAFGFTFIFWPFWPLIIVVFGILILLGAIYARRRYD